MSGIVAFLMLFYGQSGAEDCVKIETTVAGSSLEGKLWPGQEITVLGLGCGVPARYDYIVFRVDDAQPQVIKQLWGMPGDTLIVQENGKFQLNGVEARTPFGKPYVLLGSAKTRLKKLEGQIDGFVALGHPGSVDSARVGLIQRRNILGYVPQSQSN